MYTYIVYGLLYIFYIDFRSATNKRFLISEIVGGFVMHNYRGIRAFESRHVRRNSITYLAAFSGPNIRVILHDTLFTKRYHIRENAKQRDHY